MNNRSHLLLIISFLGLAGGLYRTAFAGTQSFSFQLPPFQTSDNWVYSTSGSGALPQFDPLGDRLLLKTASMNASYPMIQSFLVTNVGQVTASGTIRSTIACQSQGPSGAIWNPGSTESYVAGPNLPPGQSGTSSVSGGTNRTKTDGGAGAQAHVGTGNTNFSIGFTVTYSIEHPENITATYISGSSEPPVFKVTYDFKCNGDANEDGQVGVQDLLAVINDWGFVGFCQPLHCPSDMAPGSGALWGDAYVNVLDLLTVINHWGACPTP